MCSRGRLSIVIVTCVAVLGMIGAQVAYAGKPVGSTIFVYTDTGDNAHQVRSSVAYNPHRQEYLVVWMNDRPGFDDVYGQRVGREGELIGPWVAITAGPGAERRFPDVVFNPASGEYLVVWEHDDGGLLNIRAQRVDQEGGLLGSEFVVGTGAALANRRAPAVAYADAANKYLVIWERWVQGSPAADIEGQVLNSAGGLDGSGFVVATGTWTKSHEQPDLAYNRSRNEYLVVWQQQNLNTGAYDVYGRRVQGNGTPMQPSTAPIHTGAGDDTAPAVAAMPTVPNQGQYLVVWEGPWSPGNVDIYGQRLRGDGSLDGPGLWIGRMGGTAANPAVAASEAAQQYLVVWNEVISPPNPYSGTRARAISLYGDLLGEDRWLWWFYSDHPTMTSGAMGDILVVFESLGSDWGIYGQLWGNRVHLPLVVRGR